MKISPRSSCDITCIAGESTHLDKPNSLRDSRTNQVGKGRDDTRDEEKRTQDALPKMEFFMEKVSNPRPIIKLQLVNVLSCT